ncbi:MAG: hypothetical protein GY755_16415 [Chloroflexi bacterium]|nr:hypothetical protein [Chloroflexota bacterium]
MSNVYLIGIDIGSSYTKVSAYDSVGFSVGAASRDTHPSQPSPGVAEYDSEDILHAVYDCIKNILIEANISPTDIAAVCLDGIQSGLVGLDQNCDPSMPYSSTLDLRYSPYLDAILESHHDLIRTKTGSGQPTYLAKMIWLRSEFPEIYKRTKKFVTISGYLIAKLAGLGIDDVFMDNTYLWITGLSNSEKYIWDDELCAEFEIPSSYLPRIVKSTDIVGGISAEAARYTGLKVGTPLVAGLADQAAGFVGSGLAKAGRLADNAGTYPLIGMSTDAFHADLKYQMSEVLPSVIPGLWTPTSYIIGGGLTHHWFVENFAKQEETEADISGDDIYQILDAKAEKLCAGSEGVLFIPHLGGRACPNNSDFRGAWQGFTWSHTVEHFYRSILESIAFDQYIRYKAMIETFPDTKIEEVVAYGGGSKSALWNQIKADVMGLPYVCLGRDDISALGNSILAGYAVGLFDNLVSSVEQFVKPAERYEPNMEAHHVYQEYIEIYREMLTNSESTFAALSQLTGKQKN